MKFQQDHAAAPRPFANLALIMICISKFEFVSCFEFVLYSLFGSASITCFMRLAFFTALSS